MKYFVNTLTHKYQTIIKMWTQNSFNQLNTITIVHVERKLKEKRHFIYSTYFPEKSLLEGITTIFDLWSGIFALFSLYMLYNIIS